MGASCVLPSVASLTGRSVRFIAIGDWGSGRSRQKEVAEAMGDFCQHYRCDFIITTGDNFYKKGVKSLSDKKFDKRWRDVYTHPSIANLPWYVLDTIEDFLCKYYITYHP